MSAKIKVEGISGSDQICTLQPYKVIKIIEGKEDNVLEPIEEKPCAGAKKKGFFRRIGGFFKNLFK